MRCSDSIRISIRIGCLRRGDETSHPTRLEDIARVHDAYYPVEDEVAHLFVLPEAPGYGDCTRGQPCTQLPLSISDPWSR
jgi:hypothetical protein